MDWWTIENSYFWIGVSGSFKSITFRIRNPLTSLITEYRIHKQVVNLVGEDTEDEKKILKKKVEKEAKRKQTEEWQKQIRAEEKLWFNKERNIANEKSKASAEAQQRIRSSMGSEGRTEV
jgi:hypothetical protein